jgi:twitching motility protein PilT
MNQRFADLIAASIKNRFSDIHIVGGHPLIFRRDGVMQADKNIKWTPADIDAVVKEMLNDKQLHTLRKRWSVDVALSINQVRVRINIFYTTRGLSMAIRLLPDMIPELNSLNLHPSLGAIKDLKSGLILVCGSTGSGKSTTVAAIIEEINRSRPVHIITSTGSSRKRPLSSNGKWAFMCRRSSRGFSTPCGKALMSFLSASCANRTPSV